ncbi:MAG: hypothetical protein HOG49_43165 [Candidatus Scalindua sp.]|jgi:hypothetical protein|nr:hypothetical protein [Candidatus Scalindua sp.]
MASEKVWWIRDGKFGIGSLSGGTMTTGSGSEVVHLHFSHVPVEFTTTLTDSIESLNDQFPNRFSDVIVSSVLGKLHAKQGDMKMVNYYHQQYLRQKRRVLAYVEGGQVGGGAEAINHKF